MLTAVSHYSPDQWPDVGQRTGSYCCEALNFEAPKVSQQTLAMQRNAGRHVSWQVLSEKKERQTALAAGRRFDPTSMEVAVDSRRELSACTNVLPAITCDAQPSLINTRPSIHHQAMCFVARPLTKRTNFWSSPH